MAQVLGRSASEDVDRAWVERARRRRVEFLRVVAEAATFSPGISRMSPEDADMKAARDFEEKVLDGEPIRELLTSARSGPQGSITLAVPADLGPANRAPTFRVSRDLLIDLLMYGGRVETQFRSMASSPAASFVGFLCTNFGQTWHPYLDVHDDRWKTVCRQGSARLPKPCARSETSLPTTWWTAPTASRDDPDHVIALRSRCHLHGLHGGRLEASGPAGQVTWRVGPEPWVELHQ